jgi:hypothetical protein
MPANPVGVALRSRHAGRHTLARARPDLQAPENFTLTSPAFDHGAPIPENTAAGCEARTSHPQLDPAANRRR